MQTKHILIFLAGAAVGYGVCHYMKKTKSMVGADNFFESHSQNCSGLNCV